MRTLLSILICFFAISFGFAQFPGGISANLKGWYNANTGVTLTGGVVSQWNDQSGNANNATQGSATSRPLNTGAINYNTALTFDGVDNFLNIPDLINTTVTAMSAFGVARQASTGNDTWHCVILGQTNSSTWTGGGYGLTAMASTNNSFGFWVHDWNVNFVSYATTLSAPTLMAGTWNGTTANAVQYFQDGTSQGTDAFTPSSVGDNGSSYIGSGIGSGTDYCFDGDIAEIAVYSASMSATNVNKISSYLAVKYGITMASNNYSAAAGTLLYQPAATYTSNIIGIGREDANNLIQKQSHNYDDSTRIYISALAASNSANGGSFTSDVSYVIVGADKGKLKGINTEKPASIYSRLEREWKVTKTNFTSTFNMDFKLQSTANLTAVTVADLRLLVDDDGNFTNATVYAAGGGLSFSYSNPVITVTGISNAMIASGSTSYITVASAAGSTPLPIELFSFNALVCEGKVCLDWKTASENRNDHFEIERSDDGIKWEKIGVVKGVGTTQNTSSYALIDQQPINGVSYYRLKQVDADGTCTYSENVSINTLPETGNELKIYPNPAKNYVIIESSNPINSEYIRIVDSEGQIMNHLVNFHAEDATSLKLNTEKLADGLYFISTEPSGKSSTSNSIKLYIHH